MRYFINHEGKQKGPWTIDEVRQKISSNEITIMDYVYDDDRADWVMVMAYGPFESLIYHVPGPEKNPVKTVIALKEEWFVLRADNKYGPFKYPEIIKMLQAKQLFEFDFVWNKDMPNWTRIAEVENFKPENIKLLKETSSHNLKDIFYRRRHARASIGASIILHNNKEVWKGRSAELSLGGAGLILSTGSLQIGQDLFLHFKAGDAVPPFNAVCKIVSKSDLKNNEFRYGVKFTSISQSVQVAIKRYTDRVA